MICPLCLGSHTQLWQQDKLRPYHLCDRCSLVFVPRSSLISFEEEKLRYDTHENCEGDQRYRDYLGKIVSAVLPHLASDARGLDFGCGASTLLAQLFAEKGHQVESYDLHYHPTAQIWQMRFDFIVLSEVIEHIVELHSTMQRLQGLLKQGGQFFIKTKLLPETSTAFATWYYKNDPTHIQFFSMSSLSYLARELNMAKAEALPSTDLYRIWS